MIDVNDTGTLDLFGHGCGTCFQQEPEKPNKINELILMESLVRIPPSPPAHTIETHENQQLDLVGVAFDSVPTCQK